MYNLYTLSVNAGSTADKDLPKNIYIHSIHMVYPIYDVGSKVVSYVAEKDLYEGLLAVNIYAPNLVLRRPLRLKDGIIRCYNGSGGNLSVYVILDYDLMSRLK